MKNLIKKTGLTLLASVFAVSCASSPKQQKVEIIDNPEEMSRQETQSSAQEFPYIDFRADRI